MTAVLTLNAKQQFFDNNGRPLVGGKLFTYEAGTNIKLSTYTDSGGLSANTNPIILDYRGEANIWIPPNVAYKYVLSPASDTDPPTNPIWSVDDIVNSQLINLYGGTSGGVSTAYTLTFDSPFTAYQDGWIIYFTPNATNTGSATMNVNGLGPVSILNQGAAALTAGQIVAGKIAVIMYLSGSFLLLSSGTVPFSGTFTGTLTGGTGSTVTVSYWVNNQTCILRAGASTITSNSTAMTMTGLPAVVTPGTGAGTVACVLRDNGAAIGGWAQVNAGTGTITFGTGINNNQSGFTNSGTKGLAAGWTITYSLG